MAQRIKGVERITRCSVEASKPIAAATPTQTSAGSVASVCRPARGICPAVKQSISVKPTAPCMNSVKITNGNSCIVLFLLLRALMRLNDQIGSGDR
ncbi:Uncharacterised protein [Cronobacter sakazakii]|nr:Uncharacterised protein [Cronobacter sakazakii]